MGRRFSFRSYDLDLGRYPSTRASEYSKLLRQCNMPPDGPEDLYPVGRFSTLRNTFSIFGYSCHGCSKILNKSNLRMGEYILVHSLEYTPFW